MMSHDGLKAQVPCWDDTEYVSSQYFEGKLLLNGEYIQSHADSATRIWLEFIGYFDCNICCVCGLRNWT